MGYRVALYRPEFITGDNEHGCQIFEFNIKSELQNWLKDNPGWYLHWDDFPKKVETHIEKMDEIKQMDEFELTPERLIKIDDLLKGREVDGKKGLSNSSLQHSVFDLPLTEINRTLVRDSGILGKILDKIGREKVEKKGNVGQIYFYKAPVRLSELD